MFEIHKQGETVLVIPERDLREFDFGEIEAEGAAIVELLESHAARNLVIDFCHTDYYGSTALSFFVKLFKLACDHGGKMAFCKVSSHELEILQLTHLDTLWSLCDTREEALAKVQSSTDKPAANGTPTNHE